MKKIFQDIAREISQSLVQEFEGNPIVESSNSENIVDMLLQKLNEEVVKQVEKAGLNRGLSSEEMERRLLSIKKRMDNLAVIVRETEEAEHEEGGAQGSFPNLKYAKSKYKNVESVLKYVERDEDRGGVKLVIMNFND